MCMFLIFLCLPRKINNLIFCICFRIHFIPLQTKTFSFMVFFPSGKLKMIIVDVLRQTPLVYVLGEKFFTIYLVQAQVA